MEKENWFCLMEQNMRAFGWMILTQFSNRDLEIYLEDNKISLSVSLDMNIDTFFFLRDTEKFPVVMVFIVALLLVCCGGREEGRRKGEVGSCLLIFFF